MLALLRSRLARTLPLLLLGAVAACENPVEHEDHPVALVIVDAQGQDVARAQPVVGTTGQVTVAPGATATFQVFAIGEDGDRITIGGDTGLRLTVVGTAGTAALQAGSQLVVTGMQPGTSTLQLTLLHSGHEEFVVDVPLVVRS